MADLTFNTTSGITIEREKLVVYMNMTDSSSQSATPSWVALGKRVTDSSEEYDWSDDTQRDILGVTRTVLRKPIISQNFDPVKLDSADSPAVKVWNMAIKDGNAKGLSKFDLLIVHLYADVSSGSTVSGQFAERYSECAVYPTGIGGEGGGDIQMPITVKYGGTRQTGYATITSGSVTFTADT